MSELIGAPKGSDVVKETSTEGFVADVLDASMTQPVIVDFWAPWCGPCKTLGPMLEKAVRASKGAVRMVKLNIDLHPEIPTQMRVQSIPTVYAFKDGRPIDGFTGALPESQIKAFVERVAKLGGGPPPSPIDEALAIAKEAAATGDMATAENIYQQIIQREPGNVPALIGLARAALDAQDLDDAKAIFARIPPGEAKSPEIVSLGTAIELAELASKAGGQSKELRQRVERDPRDHQARIDLAAVLFAAGEREAALDHLLESFRLDRDWNEQAARKQLLKLFEAMGPADPLTARGRRRLSTILFS